MKCSLCGSEIFRISRLRRPDIKRLFWFIYPVRCTTCYERTSVSLVAAYRIHRESAARKRAAREARHAAPHTGANGA